MTDWAEGEKAQSLFDDVLCPWGAGDLSDRDAVLLLAAALREARGEWISVEKRLPDLVGKASRVLLVFDRHGNVITARYYRDEGGYWEDEEGPVYVTHWRPLPSPPEVAP